MPTTRVRLPGRGVRATPSGTEVSQLRDRAHYSPDGTTLPLTVTSTWLVFVL